MLRFALLLPALLAWPAFGSPCFCLTDADDALWFDCRELACPRCPQPRIFCLDAVSGEQIELTGRSDLERVARTGSPPALIRDDRKRVIRGEDDAEKTPPTATTRPADGEEDQP